MLTSESVNTFLAVARAGSFLQAADVVGASQSTVSQRIRMLEEMVGTTLILRTRGARSLSLTPAGHSFLELAERWVQIEIEVERMKTSSERRLALGSVDSLSIYVLPDLFGRLASMTPPIRLHLETGRFWQLHERVASGHLHAAFTLNPPDHVDLIVEEVARFDMMVVGAADAIDTASDRIAIESLDPDKELFIEWSQELARWRQDHRRDRAAGFVDKAHLLLPFLQRRDVWAMIPSFQCDAVAALPGTRIVKLNPAAPPLRIYLVRRRKDLTLRASELAAIRQALSDSGLHL